MGESPDGTLSFWRISVMSRRRLRREPRFCSSRNLAMSNLDRAAEVGIAGNSETSQDPGFLVSVTVSEVAANGVILG
jgi:hypothetical protein